MRIRCEELLFLGIRWEVIKINRNETKTIFSRMSNDVLMLILFDLNSGELVLSLGSLRKLRWILKNAAKMHFTEMKSTRTASHSKQMLITTNVEGAKQTIKPTSNPSLLYFTIIKHL